MRSLVLVLVISATCLHASADTSTIFNNFDPGYSFFYGSGNAVSGVLAGTGGSIAAQYFVPGQDYLLNQITMALSYDSDFPGVNAARVTLNSDSGGKPGSILMTWNVTNLPVTTPLQAFPPLTLDAGSALLLDANQRYWIVASPGADPWTYDIWNFTNTCATIGGCQQEQSSAFEVTGTPPSEVPEPSTLLLLFIGLGAVGLVAWRRGN